MTAVMAGAGPGGHESFYLKFTNFFTIKTELHCRATLSARCSGMRGAVGFGKFNLYSSDFGGAMVRKVTTVICAAATTLLLVVAALPAQQRNVDEFFRDF